MNEIRENKKRISSGKQCFEVDNETSHLVFATFLRYQRIVRVPRVFAQRVCVYKLTWRSLSLARCGIRGRAQWPSLVKRSWSAANSKPPWHRSRLEPCTPAETAVNPTCCTIEQTEPRSNLLLHTRRTALHRLFSLFAERQANLCHSRPS